MPLPLVYADSIRLELCLVIILLFKSCNLVSLVGYVLIYIYIFFFSPSFFSFR